MTIQSFICRECNWRIEITLLSINYWQLGAKNLNPPMYSPTFKQNCTTVMTYLKIFSGFLAHTVQYNRMVANFWTQLETCKCKLWTFFLTYVYSKIPTYLYFFSNLYMYLSLIRLKIKSLIITNVKKCFVGSISFCKLFA